MEMDVLCLAFDTVDDICSDLEDVALELKQKLHQTYNYFDNTIFGPEETVPDVKHATFYLTDTELLIWVLRTKDESNHTSLYYMVKPVEVVQFSFI